MNEQRDVGVGIKDLREKQLCKGNHMKLARGRASPSRELISADLFT